MTYFFKASVGRKVLVGLSGLFLFSFILVHLAVNSFLLAGPEAYNKAANFMATDPLVQIIEPLLAIGFLLHIIYSVWLTYLNQKTRPQKYLKVDQSKSATWSSRNMFVLGGLILIFLVIHISNFWFKMTFGEIGYVEYNGETMKDAYTMVTASFSIWWYVLIYFVAFILLGFHLSHGFQSAFQTIGVSNRIWKKRWTVLGNILSVIIAAGFSVIALYFFIKDLIS